MPDDDAGPGRKVAHVVDDDAAVRRSLALLLRSAGFSVQVHESGEAFLKAAESAAPAGGLPFGCVLLDLRMPGQSGIEVARHAVVSTAEEAWDELRSLSPLHRGMRYDRLEELGGIQWPCPDEAHPGSQFLHARLWEEPVDGPLAPFSVVEAQPPFEALDDEYPIRLTTGRRLESYNTGAQSGLYRSPLHRGESLDLSPWADGRRDHVMRIAASRITGRRITRP